jgi:regulator of RNase E activity RraA
VPVDVGGVYVQPADLIAADLHGAIMIPIDAAERLPAAAEALANQEDAVISVAQSGNVTVETLAEAWAESGRRGAKSSY